jgi:hypothetical protein
MEKELQEKIQKAKQEYIDNPPKRKKGCTSCKKKKNEVTSLPPIIEEDMWVPTSAEIKLAYAELTSLLGVKEDKKEFIQKVYEYIFNEKFDWNCRSCVNSQARKFRIYVTGK